jgi:hypothetical protein
MADRRQCGIDIIQETDGTPNKGWQEAPTQPLCVLESKENPLKAYINDTRTNGVILFRKKLEFKSYKLSETYETRVWTLPIVIMSESEILLDAIFDQLRETINRYTDAPFATDTNGITYSRADLEEGKMDENLYHVAMDCNIILTEQFTSVVIA